METPPQVVGEDEEVSHLFTRVTSHHISLYVSPHTIYSHTCNLIQVIVFSFFSDISVNPQIIKTIFQFNQGVNRTFARLSKYLDSWKRFKPLWKMDKGPTLDKFAQKNPTVVDYDSKLLLYSKMGQEVERWVSTSL